MREADVRQALRASLEAEHADAADCTTYVDELSLCGQVRVDLAVLNGSLTGYELKSANDSLRRLPTQVDVYSRVLDYATLVVASNHMERALPLLPDWWGCMEAIPRDGEVELCLVSPAERNPAQDPLSMALLLWRGEALDALEAVGKARGLRGGTRLRLCQALANDLTLDDLRAVVLQRLKGRKGWRSAR